MSVPVSSLPFSGRLAAFASRVAGTVTLAMACALPLTPAAAEPPTTAPAAGPAAAPPAAPPPAPPLHPRPQLVRAADSWRSLDGTWEFGIGTEPTFGLSIRVPFAPETPASGLNRAEGYLGGDLWYRRSFDQPRPTDGRRVLLHFEAADYETTVWVNGQLAGRNEGGYARFGFDVTDLLAPDRPQQELVVRCQDDPHDMAKPRGKQDWQPKAHSIWYPRTSGIWQTVWTETVPAHRVNSVRWRSDVAAMTLALDAKLNAAPPAGTRLRVVLALDGRTLVDDTALLDGPHVGRTFHLPDGGVDSARDDLLWWPHRPKLIDATLELLDADNKVVDRVTSYAAMRSVATHDGRFTVNGRPVDLRLVLDQGYWPETGLTPPDDAALEKDVRLALSMGFNGVRKHQKIEAERYLYWADRLGLMVWCEMPSAYRYDGEAVRRLAEQWTRAIERDASHPSVIAWVPLNESWGVPDLSLRGDQRHFAEAMYHLTKALDPTRPVVSNDGWEMTRTDLVNVHDYDHDPRRLAARYDAGPATRRSVGEMLTAVKPAGRSLLMTPDVYAGQPVMLTEFGGIALSSDEGGTWGYSRARDGDDLTARYARLLTSVRSVPTFGGFCYTQLTDTYQEANGLATMDRVPKADAARIALATRGPSGPAEAAKLTAMMRDAGPVDEKAERQVASDAERPADPPTGNAAPAGEVADADAGVSQ